MVSSIFSREPDLQQVFQLIDGFHLIAHFFHLPAFLSVQYIPTPRKHLRCVAVMNESLIRKFSSGPFSDLFTCHGDSPECCPSFTQHDSQLAQHESHGDRGETIVEPPGGFRAMNRPSSWSLSMRRSWHCCKKGDSNSTIHH